MQTEPNSLNDIIKEETQREIGLFLIEQRFKELKARGLTREQTNRILIEEFSMEGAWEWMKKAWTSAQGGVLGAAKESIVEVVLEYLAESLGLDPRGWLIGVFTKAISSMSIEDWEAVMDGDCEQIVTVLEEALTEEILDRLIRRLTSDLSRSLSKRLGIRPGVGAIGRGLRRVVRNMLAKYLVETEWLSELIEQAAEYVCSIDIGEVVSSARA